MQTEVVKVKTEFGEQWQCLRDVEDEYTLCGIAFDVESEGSIWIDEVKEKGNITCSQCKSKIDAARTVYSGYYKL